MQDQCIYDMMCLSGVHRSKIRLELLHWRFQGQIPDWLVYMLTYLLNFKHFFIKWLDDMTSKPSLQEIIVSNPLQVNYLFYWLDCQFVQSLVQYPYAWSQLHTREEGHEVGEKMRLLSLIYIAYGKNMTLDSRSASLWETIACFLRRNHIYCSNPSTSSKLKQVFWRVERQCRKTFLYWFWMIVSSSLLLYY